VPHTVSHWLVSPGTLDELSPMREPIRASSGAGARCYPKGLPKQIGCRRPRQAPGKSAGGGLRIGEAPARTSGSFGTSTGVEGSPSQAFALAVRRIADGLWHESAAPRGPPI
jgi:hypothetical protein